MKLLLYLFFINIFFIGCGNSTKDEQYNSQYDFKKNLITGYVVDGYIKNATVCIDENKNLNCDTNEPTTISDINGSYSFNYILPLNELVVILSQGGVDTSTNQDFKENISSVIFNNIFEQNISLDITPLTDLQTRKKLIDNNGIFIQYKNPMKDKKTFAQIQKLQVFKKILKSLDDKITYKDIKDEMINLNIDSSLNQINLDQIINNLSKKLSFTIGDNKIAYLKNQIKKNNDLFDDLAYRSNISIDKLPNLQINIDNDTQVIIDKLKSNNIIFMDTKAVDLTNLQNELKKDKLNLFIPDNKFYNTPPKFPKFEHIQTYKNKGKSRGNISINVNSGYSMFVNPYNKQNISTIAPTADIFLTYKNNKWYGYSPNETFKDDFKNFNIKKIDKLEQGDAFWVFFSKKDDISFKGKSTNKKQVILKKGWNLVSVSNIDSFIVLKSYFSSDNIESIWNYSNYYNRWSAFSPNQDIKIDIKNDNNITWMDTINTNDALWIKSKKDINITINNKAPVFINEGEVFNIHEDNLSKFSIKALDSNGENISYTILGQDSDEFIVNNGEVKFKIINSKPKKTTFNITINVTDSIFEISKDFIINLELKEQNNYDGEYASIKSMDPLINKQLYLDKKHLNILHLHKDYNGSINKPIIQVVEWGFDTNHQDLIANVDFASSYDLNTYQELDKKVQKRNNAHGTAVAGIIAARGFNDIGIRGIVPFGRISYFKKIINGASTNDTKLAWAYGPRANDISISNNSWGVCGKYDLKDEKYLEYGSKNLRYGKGRIYVMSAGNQRKSTSKCGANNTNLNTYLNNPYMIVVSAMSIYDSSMDEIFRKKDDKYSSTSTPGANILVSAYGYGGIWTTNSGAYGLKYSAFSGTSAAAPMVSGAVGLLLEACPNLTYRDVKYLLATTAIQVDKTNTSWINTQANLKYSTDYGFGKMDITSAINICKNGYMNLASEKQFSTTKNINKLILNDGTTLSIDINSDLMAKIQWVAIYLEGDIDDIGDFEFNLISPSGTKIQLLQAYNGAGAINSKNIGAYDIKSTTTSIDNSKYNKFRLSTVGLLNENSYGTFKIEITDKNSTNNQQNRKIKAIKLEILAY